jgi:hypothetical protein
MDADKNKKIRRTAIAARLPRDKLPSVIIGYVQGAEAAARDRAHAVAQRAATHRNQTPTTARKMRRLPDDE